MNTKLLASLVSLGLSELESQIYVTLNQEPGLTGYRIAKLLNKSTPNTYKALSTMESKGLVVSDDSHQAKLYRALPASEYLDSVERTFSEQRKNIEKGLSELGPSRQGEGIYRILDYTQIITKAKHLIQAAERVILLDLHPRFMEELIVDLTEAQQQGLQIHLLIYDDTRIEGCQHHFPHPGDNPLEKLQSNWMEICVDGHEFLICDVIHDTKSVHEGIWGKNFYLGSTLTAKLGMEMILRDIMHAALEPASGAEFLGQIYDHRYEEIFLKSDIITNYAESIRSP